jgi:hypothetical protein
VRRLRFGFQEYEILEWHAQSAGDPLKFYDKLSATRFLRALSGVHSNLAAMRDILTGDHSVCGFGDRQLIEQLAWRILSGQLTIARMRAAPKVIPILVEPDTEEEGAWIEIQLVGEDDRPVRGQKYQITLPDGTVKEGVTDSEGLARLEGIEPGTCQVTFPELDKDAWEAV